MPSEKNIQIENFDPNAPEFFPSTCCEFLHVKSALYVASFIQLAFVFSLTLVYLILEQSQFINAVDVFRPGVGFVVIVNLAGIFCAVVNRCMFATRSFYFCPNYASSRTCLPLRFICLYLVFTMAFGSRIPLGNSLDAKSLVQSVLVNDQHWEYFLGPFWPYLLAIIFHMTACAMICFVAIYRRYRKFLTKKYAAISDTSTLRH
uniref:Uncharacterized protein n=1 Tax=Meloidogyne enterolobii TaxID=390850 RepID=A0A6V7UQC9_MELEN|nr:unnamed protein product [Meloidogyne enterolobii]